MNFLFYGSNGAAAKAEAVKRTKAGQKTRATDAVACHESEPVDAIDFMPDVPAHEKTRLLAVFKDVPVTAIVPPPPPPPPVNPLDNLLANWRNSKPQELRELAASVNGGRMPENKEQAIAIIESKLPK